MMKKLLKNLTVVATMLAGTFSFAQTVTIVSPANGAVDVDPASDIVFTISGEYEVADAGTNRGIFIRTAPGVTTGQIKIDTDNEADADGTVSTVYDAVGDVTTVTINPTADFSGGSTVALQLNNHCFKVVGSGSPGTVDSAGIDDDNWNFTTAVTFGSIISLSPANGATDVDLTGNPPLVMVVKGEIGPGDDDKGDFFIRPVQGSSMHQTRIDADGTDPDGTVTFSYDAVADETTITIAPTSLDFGVNATGDIALRVLGDINNGQALQGIGSDAGFFFGGDVISFGEWTFSYDPLTLSTIEVSQLEAKVFGKNGNITVSGANLDVVYNIAGQQVSNQGLPSGIYIVKISKNDQVATVKIAME